jgi:hypothetical protein
VRFRLPSRWIDPLRARLQLCERDRRGSPARQVVAAVPHPGQADDLEQIAALPFPRLGSIGPLARGVTVARLTLDYPIVNGVPPCMFAGISGAIRPELVGLGSRRSGPVRAIDLLRMCGMHTLRAGHLVSTARLIRLTHSPIRALTSPGVSRSPNAVEPTMSANRAMTGCSSSMEMETPSHPRPPTPSPVRPRSRSGCLRP